MMSSPMERESSVFFTPLKNVHFFKPTSARQSPFVDAESTFASPQKSGRGILQTNQGTSPSRLLTGRGGLRSPERRDIEKSARKRLIQNSDFYRRLLDAGTSDNEDDDDNRRFAESILKISRGDSTRAYASDIDLEQDLTEDQPRQKRKHTRRKVKAASLTRESDGSSIKIFGDIPENAHDSLNNQSRYKAGPFPGDNNSVKRKRGRPRKDVQKQHQGASIANLSKTDQSSNLIGIISPAITQMKLSGDEQDTSLLSGADQIQRLKRGRPHKHKRYVENSDDSLDNSSGNNSEDNIPKRKPGRPSKHEGVTGTIKSIFDEDAFDFERPQEKAVKVETGGASHGKQSSQVSLFESALLSAPIISGIPDGEKDIMPPDPKTGFVSLPVPELTEDGELTQEYLLKYFDGKQLASANGRFLDERSFFLEGAEGYFEQNNLKARPSVNSLAAMAPTLDHAEFARFMELGSALCAKSSKALKDSHAALHRQLCFELSQGFNVCFHGLGSKIDCIQTFVEDYIPQWIDLLSHKPDTPTVMIVNGFNPHLKFKDTLLDLAKAIVRKNKLLRGVKIPRQISDLVSFIKKCVQMPSGASNTGTCLPRVVLAIHNLDGEMLRDDKLQDLLSELCSLPRVWLVASVDHVNSSLLWDLDKSRRYNFAWHDLTTLQPHASELAFKDMINMGRSKMFVGEKGARYVLTSLPTNSRKIYRQLLENQILGIQNTITAKANINVQRGTIKNGVELTRLYDKCMDAFLTSSEMLFRTVLGEFIEHSMCNLTKDPSGVEIVYIPFNYDEMQKLVTEDI